jgi:hypothetical protein
MYAAPNTDVDLTSGDAKPPYRGAGNLLLVALIGLLVTAEGHHPVAVAVAVAVVVVAVSEPIGVPSGFCPQNASTRSPSFMSELAASTLAACAPTTLRGTSPVEAPVEVLESVM